VIPLTESIHDRGLDIHARHQLSLDDAMIVAAAIEAGSSVLYSEDLQHGRMFQRSLRVVNPF
jgi:predicted nucleic acid-binding protein